MTTCPTQRPPPPSPFCQWRVNVYIAQHIHVCALQILNRGELAIIEKIEDVWICWEEPCFLESNKNESKNGKEIPHFAPIGNETSTNTL